MQINASTIEFVSWLSEVTRTQFQETNNEYSFQLKVRPFDAQGVEYDTSKTLYIEDIELLIQRLAKKKEQEDELAIYDAQSYEVLVREENNLYRPIRTFSGDSFVLRDQENNLTYTISRPTDEYLFYILYKVGKSSQIRLLSSKMPMTGRLSEEYLQNLTMLDFAKLSIPRFLSLRIQSGRDRKQSDFVHFVDALFFHLSYNLNSAILPQRNLEGLLRTGRISRLRRTALDELEAPKRIYLSQLVYHYQLAIASESPVLRYLSFYHILEHFYESVFNDELIEGVRKIVTHTGFSSKRSSDIKNLIRHITSSLQKRNDDMVFSELEALKLMTEKYLKNLPDLVEKIRTYDETLINYYNIPVNFSGGDAIDLNAAEKSSITSAIAKRIYKTRNAIVHSKDGEKEKYIPFQHDHLLIKELPLLQFVAETVMIETSSVIH